MELSWTIWRRHFAWKVLITLGFFALLAGCSSGRHAITAAAPPAPATATPWHTNQRAPGSTVKTRTSGRLARHRFSGRVIGRKHGVRHPKHHVAVPRKAHPRTTHPAPATTAPFPASASTERIINGKHVRNVNGVWTIIPDTPARR